ncbi:AaceriAFR016Wp [[Ashbya] aceris (nom. inval.)]|nr:AaceriAFR016Wp [[Ashbya] aceris (nom. inval.)]
MSHYPSLPIKSSSTTKTNQKFNRQLHSEMSTDEIDTKDARFMRLVTFNVNGLRTLFGHYPFSRMSNSLAQVFQHFKSDIITFQELKIDKLTIARWGMVDGYYSFITIPDKKKGYSGVGCWIRIPGRSDPLRSALQVLKAEEGITGKLKIKKDGAWIAYCEDPSVGIGGYDGLPYGSDVDAQKLDSEGRCLLVELACKLVIICVYCPANSMNTEEGEVFRLRFLKTLFKRVRNIENMGKRVVLMGDLNVCRDLIDHAGCIARNNIKIKPGCAGSVLERIYQAEAREFIYEPLRIGRRLLNEMLIDSIIPDFAEKGVLIDSTRYAQGRKRLKMYTVWDTYRNARPANYGSRVDYILVSKALKKAIKKADIWAKVMGSDHCPVFTDIQPQEEDIIAIEEGTAKIPRFEVRFNYDLNHNILDVFRKKSIIKCKSVAKPSNGGRVQKNATRSSESPIEKKVHDLLAPQILDAALSEKSSGQDKQQNIPCYPPELNKAPESRLSAVEKPYFTPANAPLCKHGDPSVLKTSKTSTNFGKQFWTCKRPRGAPEDINASCGFFQWKN